MPEHHEHHSHPLRRHRRAPLLIAGLAAAAIAAVPAAASAQPSQSGNEAADMSLTFTGQTGAGTWTASSDTVVANATTTDASNPVQQVVCSVDQGASTTTLGAQQTLQITGDGAHIIECYPVAWDGTQGTPQFATVQIDDQVPTVTLSGAAPSPAWNSTSATVIASASEPEELAGIQSVTCLDGDGTTTTTPGSTGSITVSGTQRYDVSCYATTNADVIGSRSYEQVWMDTSRPQVTYVNAPDPFQWYNSGQPVQVDVQTPLDGAPIASLTCDYAGQAVFPAGQLTEQAPAALHNWSVPITLPGTGTGNLNCSATDTAANYSGPSSIFQKVDTSKPAGVFVNDPTDPAVILAKVADTQSGVYGANIQYQTRRGWVTLPTTLHGGTARAVIPAGTPISDGRHALRVIVTSNAGDQFVGYDNQHSQPAAIRYPVAAATRLLYTIKPLGDDVYGHPADNTDTDASLRLSYRQGAVITGRIQSTARALLGNQPISVKVTLANGRSYLALVRTTPTGAWRYRLAAGGDRTVKIALHGTVGLQAQAHEITIRGHAAVRLNVSPLRLGTPVTLTARVLGGQLPRHGVRVIVQWRRGPSSPWTTLSVMSTDARGIASAHAAAPAVARGQRIQVRAWASHTRSWGYTGAASTLLTTTVA